MFHVKSLFDFLCASSLPPKITQNWGVIVSKLWAFDDSVNDVSGLFNVAMLQIRYRHEAAVGSKMFVIEYVQFEFHYNNIQPSSLHLCLRIKYSHTPKYREDL